MDIFEISQKEYDNLIKNSLKICGCPECHYCPTLTAEFKLFGAETVGFECPHCGYESSVRIKHNYVTIGTRAGTPITPLSLAKTIFEAAEQWNSAVRAAKEF